MATQRLPGTGQRRTERVKTGERGLFGVQKKQRVETDEYEVDRDLVAMVSDYGAAYRRFMTLLSDE